MHFGRTALLVIAFAFALSLTVVYAAQEPARHASASFFIKAHSANSIETVFAKQPSVGCSQPTGACGPGTANPVGTRLCRANGGVDCTCACTANGWLCSRCTRGCDPGNGKCMN